MAQGLGHREIGVVELDVFAHKADLHVSPQGLDPLHQGSPFAQVRGVGLDAQLPADHRGEAGALQHQGRLVEDRQGPVFDDTVGLDVTEEADLPEDALLQGLVAAQDDDIRADAHALQLLDRVLGGLGLVLLGAVQVRH